MVILALDTSSAAGSAALARDGAVVAERAGDGSRTHGHRLPRELMVVLEEAGLSLRDVDGYAVVTGPGSFTGLRVGIATMQGLALAQRKRVCPISTFDALAAASRGRDRAAQTPITTWIDAHRGEVFAAIPARRDGDAVRPPTSLPPEATLDALLEAFGNRVTIEFAGDGALKYADLIRARLGDRAILPATVPLLAGVVATFASAHPELAVSPHAVTPLYVRRPDVVLARERRAKG